MKRAPVIPEQHWLNEPDAGELKEQNAKLRAWLAGIGVACVMGWGFFGLLLWLRTR